MCEFISWVEKEGEIYFLTGKQVYDSPKGKALQEWSQNIEEDKVGHGAIRFYYDLEGGINRECIDFSNPTNFPTKIALAIKAGDMRDMGIAPQLLTQQALAEYNRVEKQALAEYKMVEKQVWAEYQRVAQQALAEYKRVVQQASAEYKRVRHQAWAEYERVEQAAWAEYQRVTQPAWAEYNWVAQSAFWDLFVISSNRNPLWS